MHFWKSLMTGAHGAIAPSCTGAPWLMAQFTAAAICWPVFNTTQPVPVALMLTPSTTRLVV